MMIKNTMFHHLPSILRIQFDAELADKMCADIEKRFGEMLLDADYRDNKEIKWHMQMNLLPGIAIYITLLGIMKDSHKAVTLTDEIFEVARIRNQRKNRWLGRLPFGYALFRRFSPTVINKQYPGAGWRKKWVRRDKKEVYFEMETCIYLETTTAYGCPELCPLFCKNDDVVLAGFGCGS